MTELRPCPACRRHVAIAETACPFCTVALAPVASRTLARGRLSRAAVFAGGALAASACGGKKPATETHTTTTATVDAGTTTPDAAEVATPPDPHKNDGLTPDHMSPKPYGAPPARRRLV